MPPDAVTGSTSLATGHTQLRAAQPPMREVPLERRPLPGRTREIPVHRHRSCVASAYPAGVPGCSELQDDPAGFGTELVRQGQEPGCQELVAHGCVLDGGADHGGIGTT